ncbi:MAG TPA: hypothetical protein VKP65_17735 [Rhodothermales bacterium]|nr:hypothetical protein [Rhodothermales bacterium]
MRRDPKKNYKKKLERNPVWGHLPELDVAECPLPLYAEQIQCLSHQDEVPSVAFQCIVVAALQTLDRVRRSEQHVAEAALSLAQRQKLDAMIATVDAVADALHAILTPQGATMLKQHTERAPETPEHLWWFALSEALHTLEEGLAWIRSVATGQARGGAAHTLSRIISLLLYEHYRDLFDEAEQWMN